MSKIANLGSKMAGFGAWHRLRDEPHQVVLYDKHSYDGGHTYSWVFPPRFVPDEGYHVSFTTAARIRDDDVLCRGAMLVVPERSHGYLDRIGIARCGRHGDWGHIWTDKG